MAPGPCRAWLPHASPCKRYHPAMAADTPARAGPHTGKEETVTGPRPPDPGRLIPVPNPLMPHPVTIECIQCGQAFVCDAWSQAAGDRTCGPCATGPGRAS